MNTNEPQRKYRKKVNRNGWMANIQRYVKGTEPRFMGYCPFFWMTWICLLAAPFIFAGRSIKFCFKLLGDSFKGDEQEERISTRYPGDEELIRLAEMVKTGLERKYVFEDEYYTETVWYYLYVFSHGYSREDSRILWVKENYSNLEHFVAQAKVRIEAREERSRKRREAMARRRARLQPYQDALSQAASYLVKPLLVAAAGVVAYVLYSGLGFVWTTWSWAFFWFAALHIGVVLGMALFIILCGFLIFLTVHNWNKIKRGISGIIPKSMLNGVSRFFVGIGTFFNFIAETVVMIYKKECPLIEWGDESGPIEKNAPKTEEKDGLEW